MKEFNFITDETEERGFIDKKDILNCVTQEEIFELVFKFKPVEFQYVTSPFRVDQSPGCWFETDITTGKLNFRDFAYGTKPLDCFDAVKIYYNLPNFFKTLEFIKTKLIDGKTINANVNSIKPSKKVSKKKVEIFVNTREFDENDKNYWQSYSITRQNLIDDKVFAVQKYKMLNTRKGDFVFMVYDLCYAYTDFKFERKKLYKPFQKKKFITNCKPDDIGGINSLSYNNTQLIISKSYKDFRVLKNQGLNVVWFQNEGMFPSLNVIFNLIKNFSEIIIFFDSDNAGIVASNNLAEVIKSIFFSKKVRVVHLPIKLLKENIKDPSDLISKKSKNALQQFLKYENIRTSP